MYAEILTFVSAIITIIYLFFNRVVFEKFNFFKKQEINGPKPSILFGTWKDAWKKDLGEDDLNNVKQHGKVFGTFDGCKPNLIVADPEFIKKILDDDASKFQSLRASRVKQLILRKCLLGIEGNEPKDLRKLLNNTLSNGKVKKLLPRIIQAAGSLSYSVIKKSAEDNPVNMSELVSNYVNDTLALTVLGLDLNSDETVQQRFHNAVNKVFVVDNPDSMLSVTPFISDLLGSLDNFILRPASTNYLVGLTDLVITERRKSTLSRTEGHAVDLVDLLLVAADEETKTLAKEKGVEEESVVQLLTNEQLVTLCMEVFVAVGRAAKSTLALSIQSMISFPDIQEKLYKELSKQLQKHGDVTYELIQDFDYLDMFVGEVLRLYPIEYRLERECVENVVWDTNKISAGTRVSVPLYAVHRLPEFYPDPEKFDPERFSAENSERRNHFTYLPFGQAGTNSTNIGIQLSVLFTKLAIVQLLTSIKFSKASDNEEWAGFVKGVTGVPTPTAVFLKAEKR